MYEQANAYADYSIEAAEYTRDSSSLCLVYASKAWIMDKLKMGKDTSYKYAALAREYMPGKGLWPSS